MHNKTTGQAIIIDYTIFPSFLREGTRFPNGETPKSEWVWSTPMGEGLHRLENAPLHTSKMHLHDLVTVNGEREIMAVAETAGYRSMFVTFSDEYWEKADWPLPIDGVLAEYHCELDWVSGPTFVISVNRRVDDETITKILKENGDPTVEWME